MKNEKKVQECLPGKHSAPVRGDRKQPMKESGSVSQKVSGAALGVRRADGFGFWVVSFASQVRSCWRWVSRTPMAPEVSGKRCSADWQSAVSPDGNRPAARSLEPADFQSAIQRTANCATNSKPQTGEPQTGWRLRLIKLKQGYLSQIVF